MISHQGGFKNQLLLLIAMLLLFPILLTFYMLHVINTTELGMVEKHKKILNEAMSTLDAQFKGDFESIILSRHVYDKSRREKVKAVNAEIKPLIQKVQEKYPNIETGFYSTELDVALDGDINNYGENFSKRRKHAFEESMKRGEPLLQILGKTEGGQLETYQPLYRNGKLIGAVWAVENIKDIYQKVDMVQRDAYIVIFIGVLFGFGGCFALIGNFVSSVNQIKNSVKLLEKDLTKPVPPAAGELSMITDAINQLTANLVKVQNYNEIILSSIDDGVIATDTENIIIGINSAAMETFAFTEDPMGKNILEVFPPESPFAINLTDALKYNKLIKDAVVDYHSAKKGILQLLVSTNLLVNIDKETVGAVLTCKDVTERVQLEQQIRRQERLASLGKLVAGVAHEIRNPLTSISGYTQFWQRNKNPSPKSLSIVHREISRMNNIVDKLLYFARPSKVVFAYHDLNALVNRTVDFFIDANNCVDGVKFVKEFAENLPPSRVDASQMEQVLLNVLYNAYQAVEKNGTIHTSTCREEDYLIIRIKDTGSGIPEEIKSRLFEPFFTTKAKGVGLGLAIANEIMQAHDGKIDIESSPGNGTICSIYIPVVREGITDESNHNGCG